MVALANTILPTVPDDAEERRVAIVLNRNARKVDHETLAWVSALVPPEDLFISTCLEDSPRIADNVIAAGYEAVLWGGGDGTFAAGVGALTEAADRRGVPVPEVGVLPLGTGNAIGTAVGAGRPTRGHMARNLRRARAGNQSRHMSMLDIEGRPALFAGFGMDAQILDDHGKTVKTLKRLGLADVVQNANLRYLLSVSGRSVPRWVTASKVEVVAVNRGAPAQRVNMEGRPVGEPIAAGRVLWRGNASLASASTIPYFGLGMKMFPHAELVPGRFQLRLCDAGTVEVIANLPWVWRGKHVSRRVRDFLVDRVELIVSKPAPFQANGDVLGLRQRVELGLWDRPVAVV